MMGLLESHFLWSTLAWLCLLGLSLWLITVLFPVPGPSDNRSNRSLEDATNREPKEGAPISDANQILHTQKKEIR
jgi:hypothetical protein